MRITQPRQAVVNALVRLGGSITDPSGHVIRMLREETGLEYTEPTAFAGLLADMERDGMLIRDRRNHPRRTYEVCLGDLPEGWPVESAPVVSETPEPPDTAPEPPSATEVKEEATETTPEAVADAILARVAEILARPDVDQVVEFVRAERNEMAERLSATLEENVRLRENLHYAQDVAKARGVEIRGLHDRLRLAEENLKAVMRQGNSAVSHEVRKQIEAFMRETPRPGA